LKEIIKNSLRFPEIFLKEMSLGFAVANVCKSFL
jgi:hypothetical protein